jgi:hypothetical protein
MEAIMVGGVAVLAIGGYFSFIDFLHDLGLSRKESKEIVTRSHVPRHCFLPSQTGIKKMAGMHV